MPVDITGLSIFNRQSTEFEFRPGPVFANIVIADEINRASPKTQSALLECMAERQVTVDGATYTLASPFLVDRDAEPGRDGRHLPAARGPARPFHGAGLHRLPGHGRRARDDRRARGDRPARHPAPGHRRAPRARRRSRRCAGARRPGGAPVLRRHRRRDPTAARAAPRRVAAGHAAARAGGPRPGRAVRARASCVPDDVQAVAVPVLAHRLLLTPDAQAGRRSPVDIVRAAGGADAVPAPVPPRQADGRGPLLRPDHAGALPARGRRGHAPRARSCSTSGTCCGSARSSPSCRCSPSLLAARTRRAVRVTRELCPPRLPVGGVGRGHPAPAAAPRWSERCGWWTPCPTPRGRRRPRLRASPSTASPGRGGARLDLSAAPARCAASTPSARSTLGAIRPARARRVRARRRRAGPAGRPAAGRRAARPARRARRGRGHVGCGARAPGPGQLRCPRAAVPPRRRAAPRALAQHRTGTTS